VVDAFLSILLRTGSLLTKAEEQRMDTNEEVRFRVDERLKKTRLAVDKSHRRMFDSFNSQMDKIMARFNDLSRDAERALSGHDYETLAALTVEQIANLEERGTLIALLTRAKMME